jgi:ADP-ribose pyrophosphatase YjhB (NUDIX family)
MAAPDPTPRRRRKAARVVVIAPDGSTFLFRYDDVEIGRHWAPPGGGLEPDETFPEAARRELVEETGWSDLEPQHLLHTWEHDYTRSGVPITQYEQVYVAFGPKRAPLGDLRASHAADEILEYRWWTPSELRSTSEVMWPPVLSDLMRNALR